MNSPVLRGPRGHRDSAGDELFASKLRAPTVREGHVPRPALTRHLSVSDRRCLSLLSAPAGYGKTVLLAEWCHAQADRRIAWISLAETENDPSLFMRYLVEAFRVAGLEVGERAQLLSGVPGTSPAAWARGLVNDLSALDLAVTLVLDDYHLISEPPCHAIVQVLLDHAPASMSLVIATRSDPPFGLGALRTAGRLTEIRSPQLRFSDGEAAAVLNRQEGLALDEAAVARLTERTEGWPAGVYLAALWLRSAPDQAGDEGFAGDDRHVVDYLGEVVLGQLDQGVLDVLLGISIVDRMSADLGAAIMGRPVGQLLEKIERENLFLVPLDRTRRWYRFHHLFGEMLRAELARRHPERVAELHSRASAWYVQSGLVEEGIEHAVLAGDVASAAELVCEHWLPTVRSGRIETVRRWVARFPPGRLSECPEVGVALGFILGMTGGTEAQFRPWLALAEDGVRRGLGDRRAAGVTSLAVGVEMIECLFGARDIAAAVAGAARTVRLEREAEGPLRAAATANLGLLLHMAGDRDLAGRVLGELLRKPHKTIEPFALIVALATASLIALDDGRTDEGDRLAREAIQVATTLGLPDGQVTALAHVALGRVLAAAGQHAEAREELERGVRPMRDSMLVSWQIHGLLNAVPAMQRVGDPALAFSLLQEAEMLLVDFRDAGALRDRAADCRRLLRLSVRRRSTGSRLLTEAEMSVLRELPSSRSVREIALGLSVSVNTVKTHITAIYRKLDVGSRNDAVARARELSLL